MAPPHTTTTTTSKGSHRPALPKGPVIFYRTSFKARPTIPSLPAFNCSDENIIQLYLRVQEEEAMKLLRLEEAKIREKFQTQEEELLENFRQEREASKILDGVSESLARTEINRNSLKEDTRRSQRRKGTVITPRSTSPPTNRTGPNEGTKNAPTVSDTRYSLFTLEQDLASSTNIEHFSFERPPLRPLTPTAETLLRFKLPISNFKSYFPGLNSTPHKLIGRSHLPAQQQPSPFFSGKLDESEKENLDELAVLRQQQQHLLFATPATTATLKAKKIPIFLAAAPLAL